MACSRTAVPSPFFLCLNVCILTTLADCYIFLIIVIFLLFLYDCYSMLFALHIDSNILANDKSVIYIVAKACIVNIFFPQGLIVAS
jgi:hypothetical protein